ncbi:metallophosphoesterase [Ectobacillus funiculus]|uniref:Metallophosphoesterase n=1 Tax=Ectobacillus funiculus TaxID=137993 RepID=A0ABV5WPD2_9BACI
MTKITRRAFLKKSFCFSLYTLLTSGIGYYYARHIEPSLLVVTRHSIRSPLIPKSFHGMKIVQFSDLHLGYYYSLPRLAKVVNRINQEKADIVFFTGDLIDDQRSCPFTSRIAPILQRIHAPFGKYCIYGNHDHGGYGTELYKVIMNESGFILLQNSEQRIRLVDGSEIAILGIDDMMLGNPKLEQTLRLARQELYTIVLVHEPDAASVIAQYPVNLQLSGHSHGGQVQLPIIGPVITPPLAKKYIEGFYTVSNLTVYVNRGLGMTRVPFRFFAQPEITVFTLQHGE